MHRCCSSHQQPAPANSQQQPAAASGSQQQPAAACSSHWHPLVSVLARFCSARNTKKKHGSFSRSFEELSPELTRKTEPKTNKKVLETKRVPPQPAGTEFFKSFKGAQLSSWIFWDRHHSEMKQIFMTLGLGGGAPKAAGCGSSRPVVEVPDWLWKGRVALPALPLGPQIDASPHTGVPKSSCEHTVCPVEPTCHPNPSKQ